MKLYYAPGACSLSPHIVSRELGINVELKKTSTKDKTIDGGGDYWKVNGKGYVPALELDNGQVLTEGPAIVQYLADQKPESALAPKAGSLERYRLQEWLNFVTSEIHKTFSPLFRPTTPDEYKKIAKENLANRFGWLDKQLAGKDYLMGKQFTVADAYLFTVLRWTVPMQIDLAQWPNLKAYFDRVDARPKVKEALKAEGLVK
ncbi:MAG TPA: glutathione transferase GstA [Burkholderiales bacterium]|jgi:glutathione S-transferase|nr:glutathione transferase GstA [Burkholderiales bacterium]